ncbi:Uncharacterised protein [Mycobacteroides abscessus subsp. abscessus]|nr:Uncharacterised protein [Mycobacteroides abscessus subsp. abscessus]SIC78228.1 Uncharacterised protein [Mycobacteroides abscessus subsp. abscessus]
MADRVGGGLGPEHRRGVGQRRGQLKQTVTYLSLTCAVPFGDIEGARLLLPRRNTVLQGVDLYKVRWISGIDQGAHHRGNVARTGLLLGDRVLTLAVENGRYVVVFGDELQRHEPLARIGRGNADRPGVQIEHRRGIQRVAVLPDYQLAVQW